MRYNPENGTIIELEKENVLPLINLIVFLFSPTRGKL